MDVVTCLLDTDFYVQEKESFWDKVKQYARSVDKKQDYFFQLIINKNDEFYDVELIPVPCESSTIEERIFYMKLPTQGNPYSCSATLKQLMKPVGLKFENYAFYQVGIMLPDGHYLKESILDMTKSWQTGKVRYVNDKPELKLDLLEKYLKEKGCKKPLSAPTTLVLNGHEVMQDLECQQVWFRYFMKEKNNKKLNSKLSGKCIFCGKDTGIILEGSKKWKLYTTTRKTHLNTYQDNYLRCSECENKISETENYLESFQVFLEKDKTSQTNQFCLPLFNKKDGSERLIKRWLQEIKSNNIRNKLKRTLLLRNILIELELFNLSGKITYLTSVISRGITFTLKEFQVIPIEGQQIQKYFDVKEKLKDIYSENKIKYPDWKFLFLLKEKDNNYYVKKLENVILHIEVGLTPFDLSYISRIMRAREKEISRKFDKSVEGFLVYYELIYQLLKGVDVLQYKETKEYAAGVLLRIAEDAQYRKYLNLNKEKRPRQTPIARKFIKMRPNQIEKVIALTNEFFRTSRLSDYDRKMIQEAMKHADKQYELNDGSPEEKMIAFYMGYWSWEFYPEVEKRPIKKQKPNDDKKEEIVQDQETDEFENIEQDYY